MIEPKVGFYQKRSLLVTLRENNESPTLYIRGKSNSQNMAAVIQHSSLQTTPKITKFIEYLQ